MKAGVLAVAAAIATGASAANHAGRRHAHAAFHGEAKRDYAVFPTGVEPEPTCGCTTIYSTWYGEPTLYNPPAQVNSTSVASVVKPTTPAGPPTVPTNYVTVFPTPGTYTIPATTITLTESTTVYAPTTTSIPSAGTYTAGGVTTVVTTKTNVVCPYATTGTSEGVVTSTILTTEYVCPTAGTYTIAPLTTTVSTSTVWVYPVPTSYPAGTYTQPEQVVTVTATNYVYVCPFTSPAPAPAAPTYVASPVAVAPVVETYVAQPAATTASTVKPSSSTGELHSSNDQPYGITYTPYTPEGDCKDAASVLIDVGLIAAGGFDVLRVYSSDCSALANVGAACKAHGVRMVLGVFIKESGVAGAQQQVTDIISWGQFDLVDMIIIGNEALMQGFVQDASQLAGFISSSKAAFQGAGWNGPVSTAEPLNYWQKYADVLCPVIDVVGCNIHPFFNAETSADQAGEFAKSQLDLADALCPGKYAINTESGWPSGGRCNGKACPGHAEQAAAIKSIKEVIGYKSIVFSFQNDLWKAPGEFQCEQTWGIIELFE
ncbi:glycoside hydrolase superfamily [Bisporella sp. PMI_857]|nr:glycoside hydrolase superfamily [Bisporella sp. PMI_857]